MVENHENFESIYIRIPLRYGYSTFSTSKNRIINRTCLIIVHLAVEVYDYSTFSTQPFEVSDYDKIYWYTIFV